MADPAALTLAFLSNHRLDAARVLDALPSAQVAALLTTIPARTGAPVLAAMLPTAAARVLDRLGDDQALDVLNACGAQAAVALLRHVPEPKRTRLIGGLSTITAVASRVLLGFPEDAVGAWADPEILTIAGDARVTDALQRLRLAGNGMEDMVYLVDGARRLAGVVTLNALLRASEHVVLAGIAEPPAATLPAMTPVAAAIGLPAWTHTLRLPVIDRDHRLIGVVHRSVLTRATGYRSTRSSEDAERSVTSTLAASYWDIISVLLQAGLALVPATKRVLPEKR